MTTAQTMIVATLALLCGRAEAWQVPVAAPATASAYSVPPESISSAVSSVPTTALEATPQLKLNDRPGKPPPRFFVSFRILSDMKQSLHQRISSLGPDEQALYVFLDRNVKETASEGAIFVLFDQSQKAAGYLTLKSDTTVDILWGPDETLRIAEICWRYVHGNQLLRVNRTKVQSRAYPIYVRAQAVEAIILEPTISEAAKRDIIEKFMNSSTADIPRLRMENEAMYAWIMEKVRHYREPRNTVAKSPRSNAPSSSEKRTHGG